MRGWKRELIPCQQGAERICPSPVPSPNLKLDCLKSCRLEASLADNIVEELCIILSRVCVVFYTICAVAGVNTCCNTCSNYLLSCTSQVSQLRAEQHNWWTGVAVLC